MIYRTFLLFVFFNSWVCWLIYFDAYKRARKDLFWLLLSTWTVLVLGYYLFLAFYGSPSDNPW